MTRALGIIRFLLTPVAALTVWFVVAAVGIYTESQILPVFCPEGFGSGRDCYAPCWRNIEFVLRLFFVGLSAISVVAVSIWLAPVRKYYAGLVCYFIGLVVATLLASGTDWWLWLSAGLCGLLPLYTRYRFDHRTRQS